ncbi:MAG: hypothetical protein M1823_007370, partial [Watsoniomyces obsoletus]
MANAPNTSPSTDVESREETQIVPTDPEPVEQPPSDQPPLPIEDELAATEATPASAENSPPVQATPEPQLAISEPAPLPPQAELPEWVTWEDDTSTPNEDELKEVLSTEENALDVPSIEKKVYEEVDDPEQRPAKKIRLSWVIKG